MNKQCYLWATPSGPINLIEGMPVHPNERIKIERNGSDIQVVKDGNLVVWSVDARADDYAYSNAENYAHRLKVQLLKEYESTLQAAKDSSAPIQDQERAKKMIELLLYEKRKELTFQDISSLDVMANVIYGPFTVEYRIDEVFSHCTVGEKHYVKVAILLPERVVKNPEVKDRWHSEWRKIVDAVLEPHKHPMCRDCADENGTCPSSGLPCDPTEEVIEVFKRLKQSTTPEKEPQEYQDVWNDAQLSIKSKLATYSNDLVCDLARWAIEALKEGGFTITRKL